MASEEVQEEVKGVVEENHVVTENGVPEEKTVTDIQDKGIVEAEGEDEEVKQVTADVSNGSGADVSGGADVTKEVDASMPEPDSWEDVEALEERLKTLSTVDEIAAEKERKDEKIVQGGGASGSGGGRLSPQRIVVDGRQGAMPDQVDQVLRMGLTNPRDPGDRLASKLVFFLLLLECFIDLGKGFWNAQAPLLVLLMGDIECKVFCLSSNNWKLVVR